MTKLIRKYIYPQRYKISITLFLIVLGVLSRTVFHVAPNVEFVTAISLIAGYYLGGIYLFLVPLGVMAASDMFIGNTNIFLFTWSAYLVGGFSGLLLRKFKLNNKVVLAGLGAGIVFSIFFYLYTNFGVWLITPLYEKTFSGLLMSYYMGLPFLRLNLIGNLIIVPAVFMIAEFIRQGAWQYQKRKAPAMNTIGDRTEGRD